MHFAYRSSSPILGPMTTTELQRPAARARAAGPRARVTGVALMLGSGLSNQVGAATGALAFPVIGPAGVVAVRQWVAGLLLWGIGRPRVLRFTWPAVVAGAGAGPGLRHHEP